MSFFDKLKAAYRKIKGKLIVFGILILAIVLWLVMPFCVAKVNADMAAGHTLLQNMTGATWWSTFLMDMGSGLTAPWTKIGMCFTENYIGTFLVAMKWTIIFCAFAALIGIAKAFPKHEYQDIENGSSDWCVGGEQYRVLSRKERYYIS